MGWFKKHSPLVAPYRRAIPGTEKEVKPHTRRKSAK